MIHIPKPDHGRYIDSSDPNRCSWNRELECGLPDSRLRGPRRRSTTVAYRDPERGIDMLMERVFCANCGGDGGLVTADMFPHIFFVCDSCVGRSGPPPGLVEMDAATERAVRGG